MAQYSNAELVANLSPYFIKRGESIDVLAIDKSVIAGDGLTGGGALTSDVTLNVGEGTAIDVQADTINLLVKASGGLDTDVDGVFIDQQTPSGLAIDGTGLAVADSLAGDGLAIASKIMSIDLKTTSGLAVDGTGLSVGAGDGIDVLTATVAIDLKTTSGLAVDGTGLSVGAGDGIDVLTSTVAINLKTTSGLAVDGTGLSAGAGDGINVLTSTVEVDVTDLIGDGIVEEATNNIALGTPGTLTWDSTNAVTASSHTHDVDAQANPGAAAAILRSNASGELTLVGLTATTLTTPTLTAAADLTISPTGDIIIDPTGDDIYPNTSYDINLGLLNQKWLTIHAAELWVSTLVAQDTIATIGGRILVGPTTVLTSDFSAVDTDMIVEHNSLTAGDIVLLESNGSVEWVKITSGPTGVGPYTYDVTGNRNLDGSGANAWNAGDAVFNTGTTGDGFIDLYSVSGVLSGSGPTIVGNVRTGTTYNNIAEAWAIGNLNGVYGYVADTYGVGLGREDKEHITIDETDGIRFFDAAGSTVLAQWDADIITLGDDAGGEYLTVASTGLEMYAGGIKYVDILATGTVTVGTPSQERVDISTSGITIYNGSNQAVINLDSSGNVTFGRVATDFGNMHWNETSKILEFRGGTSGTVVEAYIDTDGSISAGSGTVVVDSSGILMYSDGDLTSTLIWKDAARTLTLLRLGSFSSSNLSELYSLDKLIIRSGEEIEIKTQGSTNGVSIETGTGGTEDLRIRTNLLDIWQGDVRMAEGLWVGNASSTPTDDDIRADGDIAAASGLYAGNASGEPGTGEVIATVDGRFGGGIYVGGIATDPGTGEIIATNAIFINETADAGVTIGLVVNQGANDDAIISIKSSDIAHGVTNVAETDTYGYAEKFDGAEGGLRWMGMSEGEQALVLSGTCITGDTTKTSSALGVVRVISRKKSGTGTTTMGANENLFVVAMGSTNTARFIIDAEGDAYTDGTHQTYDDYDDIQLARALDYSWDMSTIVDDKFREWIQSGKTQLAKAGIVHYNEDGHHFINTTKLQRLHNGAIWQLHERISQLESQLAQLSSQLAIAG